MRQQLKLWGLRYGIAILVLYVTAAIYQHFFGAPPAQSLSTYFFNHLVGTCLGISIAVLTFSLLFRIFGKMPFRRFLQEGKETIFCVFVIQMGIDIARFFIARP